MSIKVHQLKECPQPQQWKTLERHPLSAEHDNIKDEVWANFVADLKEFGNVIGRPIVLYDGKVVDGWQFQRAHIELDSKPKYVTIPDGIDVTDWVRIMCDNRRHEDYKEVLARHKAILKARSDGKSVREIAKEQKVSPTTVARSIAKTGAKTEKVKGKDGKTYKAAKAPKKAPKEKGFKIRYTAREFDHAFGPLLRQVDVMARSFDRDPNENIFKQLRAVLTTFKSEFFEVYKDCLEKAKKAQ